MIPILLKGHTRSITAVRYNVDGDLIFTASKHPNFAVWYADNGERLGTYNGHNGAVWSLDVDRHTQRILSGSADTTVKLWNVETGREFMSWTHKAPVRSVQWSLGEKFFLTVTDHVLGFMPTIYIWDLSVDARIVSKPAMEITGRNESKILDAIWGPLNENIITACEDGTIRVYDVKNGEQVKVISEHTRAVQQISYNKNRTMFVSASKDGTSKLFDAKTFKCLKTYHTGRPINSASISPDEEYECVIVGGGQSADTVTTTRVDSAQFRVRFFHTIYQEELGSVQGHFGPVNALAFNPDGRGFASGGEDGYVRLHHFDRTYFTSFSKEAFKNKKRATLPSNTKEDDDLDENS